MHWFVTDAQLAALHLEAARNVDQSYQNIVAALTARHDAEIQRLREDRAMELARVADPQGPFVAHLVAEVAFWRLQFQHERQRSEIALDQCRVTHQNIGPVSMPPREDRPPSALASALGPDAEAELAAMGRTDL